MEHTPVRYSIAPLSPEAHLFEVLCTVADPDPQGQRFALPAWIPGSYLVRDFARHIVAIGATRGAAGRRRPVPMEKIDKHTWRAAPVSGPLTVRAEVYAWDLSVRGALGGMFALNIEAFMFWVETAAFVAPLVILANAQSRKNPAKLFIAACSLIMAGFLLRIDSFLVGYETGPGWHYFPSVSELMVSIGMIALEILGYIVLVRYLPILPGNNEASAVATNK